jgi:hypothetical protein
VDREPWIVGRGSWRRFFRFGTGWGVGGINFLGNRLVLLLIGTACLDVDGSVWIGRSFRNRFRIWGGGFRAPRGFRMVRGFRVSRRLRVLGRTAEGAGLAREAGKGDLGDVDEPGGLFLLEGAQDCALGDAGDEAADVVLSTKEGHGAAVCAGRGFRGVVAVFVPGPGLIKSAVPGLAAVFYGNKRGPIGACG